MPIDDGITSLWAVVVPQAATNLCTNPSFELATTGWTVSNATLTRTAGAGTFGAYGGRMLASATVGNVMFDTGSPSALTYVASIWVKASSPLVLFRIQDTGGQGSNVFHPGDGLWHRLSSTFTGTSSGNIRAYVIDNRTSAWSNIDLDGLLIELGSAATTYVDGDQDGCSWTGTPHGSTSTRNGRDGRGGAIIDFATIGLYVTEIGGAGNAPVDVATQQLAYTDGSVYVRSLAKERVLTLTAEMLYPTGLIGALHTVRTAVVSALNLDKRDGRGPIVLRYGGASTPKRLTAYYEGGLEMEKVEPTTEIAPLRFLCPDPYYAAETETQATPATVDTIAVSRIAYRSPLGVWSGMGGGAANVPTTAAVTAAVRLLDGRIVVGGSVFDFGGTAANDNLAAYNPTTGAWSLLASTAPNAAANCMALGLDGTLYIGGLFTDLGNASGDYVVGYNPISNLFFSLSTGANNNVYALAVDPATGYLWASGGFTSIGGTASNPGMAYWNGSAWVNANTGLPGGAGATTAQAFTFGPDGAPYLASAETIYRWSGTTWASIGAGSGGSNVNAIMWNAGYLYAAGSFTTLGGVTASRVARWNGSGWSAMGSGAGSGILYALAADGAGNIYVSGYYASSIGGISTPGNIALWNGSTWLAFPATPPVSNTPAGDLYRVFTFNDGSLLLGWSNLASGKTYGANLTAPSITTITNSGSANAYPIIEFTSSGQLFSLANLTTGQQMTFNNLGIASSETATLDLRPGRKTFKALTRDLRGTIVAGSDLATFTLAPGDNRIAVYALGGTATVHFKSRSWSAD